MTPLHLIAYDIAAPRRLGRVHRLLKSCALPLQYSVFLADCSEKALDRLTAELSERIDARRDDVRIYRLPDPCLIRTLGRPILPGGLQLGGLLVQPQHLATGQYAHAGSQTLNGAHQKQRAGMPPDPAPSAARAAAAPPPNCRPPAPAAPSNHVAVPPPRFPGTAVSTSLRYNHFQPQAVRTAP